MAGKHTRLDPVPCRQILRLDEVSSWLVPLMGSLQVPFRLEDESREGVLGTYVPSLDSPSYPIAVNNCTIAFLRVPAEARLDAVAIARAITLHADARHAIHDLAGSLSRAWKETNFNYDLSQRLHDIFDVAEACRLIVYQLARMQRAQSAQLYLCQKGDLVMVAGHPDAEGGWELAGAQKALERGVPEVVATERAWCVCLPLIQGSQMLGALCLSGEERLTHAANVKFLSSICTWIAQALSHRYLLQQELNAVEIRRDLELASEIQRGLHPTSLPDLPGVGIASRYLPAQFVGGDGFDLMAHEGGLDLLIADVSGHGVASGLLISNFMSMIRAQDRAAMTPAELAKRSNLLVCREVGASDYYMTGLFSRLSSDARKLTYSTMGHPPPLLWRKGSLRQLPAAGGMPAGLWGEGDYQEAEVELQPGDRLIFHTDGLTEARSPEGAIFGLAGLAAALVKGDSPEAMLTAIFEACSQFSAGKMDDDRTAILLEIREERP